MRTVYQDNGYQEVKAPQILDLSLWKKTGHWDNYRENMFTTESENRVYGLKPMNCPGHVQIFNAGRSEEHTSELQSLMRISYAVFCLKKKKNRNNRQTKHITSIHA